MYNFDEIMKMNIEKDGFIFTPRCEEVETTDEDGNTVWKFNVIKTADEVYQEWLDNKTIMPQPTELEILKEKQELIQKALDDLLLGGVL